MTMEILVIANSIFIMFLAYFIARHESELINLREKVRNLKNTPSPEPTDSPRAADEDRWSNFRKAFSLDERKRTK